MAIDQETLKKELEYDKNSGLFYRKTKAGKYNIGEIAGSINSVSGYVQIKINQKCYFAHRLAFLYVNGSFPDRVDHINHKRNDNRWENLRSVSLIDNCKNRSISKNNKSGLNGVSICPARKIWRARLKVGRKDVYIGHFTDLSCAKDAIEIKKAELGFHANHGK